MKISVPLIPDDTYIHFLADYSHRLESIYFALHSGPVLDSRARFRQLPIKHLAKTIHPLSTPRKYCLLNSRFIDPSFYSDKTFLSDLAGKLDFLKQKNLLDGVVFSDAYLLTALSRFSPELARSLEAIPSINMMIDSCEKAGSLITLIDRIPFQRPDKLVLDRSLNRDLVKLERVGRQIKQQFPDIKLEIIANEGCILHCPFKLSHDAHISFANMENQSNQTHYINREFGCFAYYLDQPEKIFQSPFIRPEDVRHYQALADSIKLCGRTLGPHFLMHSITAYLNGCYKGNLLDLMDASNWLSESFHIDNTKLGEDFLSKVTRCTNDCKNCKICTHLFQASSRKKKKTLKHFKHNTNQE
jgi:hypothetical protein